MKIPLKTLTHLPCPNSEIVRSHSLFALDAEVAAVTKAPPQVLIKVNPNIPKSEFRSWGKNED